MSTKQNLFKNQTNIFVLSDGFVENEKTTENETPVDFETAVSATGFGKFNFLLYVISIPACLAPHFETTSMSYVFPAAQCDLELTLSNKGLLNAITYLGMVTSAFVWGFLCDTLGRKKLLIVGFLLDAFFVLMSASSQTFTLLMVSKFFGGFIINGPFAALTAYLSEFHAAKYRARVQMICGIIFSCGNVLLPLVAWLILPQNITYSITDNFVLHSWNFYLIYCAIPALMSGIIFIFLPESPKFLMTTGRNEEALKVFKKVYRINTGKSEETYPIKELLDEIKAHNDRGGHITAHRTKIQAMKEGWQQIAPLFFPPHLKNLFLVCMLQIMIIISSNTLRLWLPQIFQAINDYKYYQNETASLCTMLEVFQPAKNASQTEECFVNLNNSEVYINSMIVAFVSICGYIVAGSLINILGKKRLLNVLGIVAGIMSISLYFSQDTLTTIAVSSVFVSLASICGNVVLTVIVDLFPTTLRTMTISITMMVARSGSMMGNLVFPILLQTGCAPPFFTVGGVIACSGVLACLLPNTDLKALE